MSERAPASASDPAGYLEAILDSAHPLMVEAFYLAAIPRWYNLPLLEEMRQRDDGRGPGLVERLARYSFISPLGSEVLAGAYFVHAGERDVLQQRWLTEDAQAYRTAHRRALAFWEVHPDPDYFAQAQNRLYHLLIVEPEAGMNYLVDRFRTYRNDHHLPAIERLLDTAREAEVCLASLADPAAGTLHDLLEYLGARLDQLCGQWQAAQETLAAMHSRGLDLDARLRPYVMRARANGQAHQGRYAQAIEGLEKALAAFDSQLAAGDDTDVLAAERGYTLVALGDAYAGLAVSAGGYHDREPRRPGFWYRLREVAYFLVNLPLVLYLSVTLGRRVWNPHFWPALIGLDWIIARLFAIGARYYRQADPILEAHGEPSEGVVADEKLAYLYLRLGDAQGAKRLFSRLLAEVEAPLGPYRQASVRVGLGEALLQLRQPEKALELLRAAIPALAGYGDRVRRARARELLAEALLVTGEQAEAMGHLDTAWRAYQQEGRWIDATRVAEHLEARLQAGELSQKVIAQARAIIDGLRQRRYPGRYRHPVLVHFRHLTIGLLPLILILAPLWSIHLDTGLALAPEIRFRPSPVVVLQNDEPVLNLQMSQGVQVATVYRVVISSTLLKFAVAVIAGYLILSLLLGLAVIILTPLDTVETRERGATVSVGERSIEIGQPEGASPPNLKAKTIHLPHIALSQFVQANVRIWRQPVEQGSAFGLANRGEPVVIRGSTTWYGSLLRRTGTLIPAGAQVVDLDYSVLRSRMGIVYGLNLALIVLLGLLAAFARQELILYDFPGTPYSIVELYPYLYLGLVVPPLWWGVVQPLRQEAQLRPRSRLPLGMLGLGLLLAAIQVLLRFRPLLTVLNLYLPLATIVILISAEAALWHARVDHKRVHSVQLRAGTAAVAAAVCLLMASVVWRDVRAYHALVRGNTLRDRALETLDPAQQATMLDRAIEAYGQAADVGSRPVWGIDTRLAGQIGAGLPTAEKLTWVSALHSRAALEAEAGHYVQAAQSYTQTLDYVVEQDRIYALQALAYLSQGTRTVEGTTNLAVDPNLYSRAIQDLGEAIQRDPDEAIYYVWRGAAYQSLGQIEQPDGTPGQGATSDLSEAFANYQQALEIGGLDYKQRGQTLVGLGWLAYEQAQYDEAIKWFQKALQADDSSAAAWLGMGYALYKMDRFEEALQIWEKAAELEPQDPAILISLGTVHWKLGGQAGQELGREPCVEYQQAKDYFGQATERDKLWPQADEQVAFTYRTRGHIEYLLASCPGYNQAATYELAINSFGLALALDANQAHYWYRKGRLGYSLALVLRDDEPGLAGEKLLQGTYDVSRAIELVPGRAVYWHDRAWMSYLTWSWGAVEGLEGQRWLFRALADVEQARQLDDEDRGPSYRPNYWRRRIRPAAVDGGLARGNELFEEGAYEAARAYYELVAENVPDQATAPCKAGLASLAQGDVATALDRYREGLARAAEGSEDEILAAMKARLELELRAPDLGAGAGAALALFEEAGIRLEAASPKVAFALGLEGLEMGRPEVAQSWYQAGLAQAKESDDPGAAEQAMMNLYRALLADERLEARPILALFQAAGIEVVPDEAAVAFDLAVAWLVLDDQGEAARYSDMGLVLAVEAGDMEIVRAGADDLRDYFLAHPEADQAAAYWPLHDDALARRRAVAGLDRSDLYWRYRAEFGFHLLVDRSLLRQSPGDAELYDEIFQVVVEDVERAYALNPEEHQTWRDFFVDANIGWIYLRLGDDYGREGAYEEALAAYDQATRRIQPESQNAALDLTDAYFGAGLTALRLARYAEAEAWYEEGIDLVRRYDAEFRLSRKIETAVEALDELLTDNPDLAPFGQPIRQELEALR